MNSSEFEARASQLDDQDELAGFRSLFSVPGGRLYLDGNSLGAFSIRAQREVLCVLSEWKELGIAGWLEASPPWYFMADRIRERLALLVGAESAEIAVGNSTTVNIHQLLSTLYRADASRPHILIDELAFPTDHYAVESHLRLRGQDPARSLAVAASRNGYTVSEDDIARAMDNEVQMVLLPSVVYRSGQLLDIPWLTRRAHERGILVGFDCSHSVGAIPHQLSAWGVDFAIWCTYKYLNGGPGSVAALYLSRRHWASSPGLAGWFGGRKDRQFDMSGEFTPTPDANALQIGTPHVLSMAPLHGTLETILEAGIDRIRAKSLRLTRYLAEMAHDELEKFGFRVVTPQEDVRRGGHIALAHAEARRISEALREAEVIVDHRPPDLVRMAPAALYTSFRDCCNAMERLKTIMVDRAYERFPAQRALIT
jgi:kynureninase